MLQKILKNIRTLDLLTSRKVDSLFAGNYRSAFHGRGIEFSDIREYDENDSFRDIDWSTTAKQGKLYVKKYHESRELPAMAIVDTSASMLFSSHKKSKGETALELIAILGFSALKNNDPFGALFLLGDSYRVFPPKKGHAHLWKILTFAVEQFLVPIVQKSNNGKNISEGLKIFRNRFRTHSVGFFITDLMNFDDKEFQKNIKIAKKRHLLIPLFVHDPIEREMPEIDLLCVQAIESKKKGMLQFSAREQKLYKTLRAKRFQHRELVLQKIGIHSLSLFTDTPILKDLLLFFRRLEQLSSRI